MALIYRAYFALNKNPRINSKGLNTSAILGFGNTLFDVLRNEKPTHIGVAFDTMAPTVRKEGFIDYKANRESIPEDIAISLPYIRKLIDAFNIPILLADGYEADDVIGTLVKKAEKLDFITYMMTPDKDFGQLVSDKTFIYKPARMGNTAEILGVKEVCEKFSIKNPEQVIDILGLWGDASDNIPGIPGIGEKRSKELITTYGSVENIIANSKNLKGKMRENVETFARQGLESKMLATIILDVPVEFDEKQLKIKDPDEKALKELFAELEFKVFAKRVFTELSLKKQISGKPESIIQEDLFSQAGVEIDSIKNLKNTPHKYFLVETKEERQNLINLLQQEKFFCFDTETTGIDPNNSELVGVSFSVKSHEAYFVSLPENYNESLKIINEFKSLFEDTSIEKVGQNIKFDISFLKWYDIEVKGKFFDTMLAHYLIEPDMRHNMDFLSEKYLSYEPVSYNDLTEKKGSKQLKMRDIQKNKLQELKEYAAEDADITLQLKYKLKPLLKETKTQKLFEEIEIPLVPVLASMEAEGVKIDINNLKDYSKVLQIEINEVEKEIHDLAGEEFNIGSPKQLGIILFEKIKISDKPKLTKTKQYSTGEEVLTKLEKKHPIISKILDYRSLTKLKSTYVDTLPMLVNKRDGRIHTSYNQAVTSTGRLSSKNPNLQNIPVRTEKGREIRKAFIPRNDDYTLLAADYSQIELRIIAHLSKDKNMIEAFNQGLDIHTATASRVYGTPIEQITKDMRRNAKTVNFGIIYGISAFGLSERLNIPRGEAREIINQYFRQYPEIKNYMDKSISFARLHGYVETMMGRRRYLRDINSANATIRGFAERNAINAPIQGSSADMIKIAMINIFNDLSERNLKTRMILQVHDELVFDTCKNELDIVKSIVENRMKNALKLDIPVVVDINTGKNWLEAH